MTAAPPHPRQGLLAFLEHDARRVDESNDTLVAHAVQRSAEVHRLTTAAKVCQDVSDKAYLIDRAGELAAELADFARLAGSKLCTDEPKGPRGAVKIDGDEYEEA